MDDIRVPVVRMEQKSIPVFAGKMRARDLLGLCRVKEWEQNNLLWYQRQKFEDKVAQMQSYLERCPVAVVPAVLLGLREVQFESQEGGAGTLRIPREEGFLSMIDGQHRLGGFEWAANDIAALKSSKTLGKLAPKAEKRLAKLEELMGFEIPVVFVDSASAAKAADSNKDTRFADHTITADEAERVIFFIQNKTQKGLNPSHKDQLAYRIWYSGIAGIPAIEREEWRAHATRVVNALNEDDSPLAGLINIGARSKALTHRVRLSSFVTSVRFLYRDKDKGFHDPAGEDRDAQFDRQLAFFEAYWSVLRDMFESAFRSPEDHLLLRAVGVYAANHLAADVFEWCHAEGIEPNKKNIHRYIGDLNGFDWTRDGPLGAFGGQKGADAAYMFLLVKLAESQPRAKEHLEQLRKEEEARRRRR